VWVTPQEHEFIRKSSDVDFCKLLTGIRYEEYGFEGDPYLGFPASRDVYGDGSIVVVPAFGHTPGSVIIFVTLPSRTRYAFVGDLVWQLEGITQARGAPLDHPQKGRYGCRSQPRKPAELKERLPDLIIVPAH
jgi:glyoxylase-like metal-dependent hydrolase (beta-lactamase superfamily II)